MSFCRWSSDGGQCDLYCYEDVNGGFTTHVAGSRRAPPLEGTLDPFGVYGLKLIQESRHDDWMKIKKIWDAYLDSAELVKIQSEHAGQSYNDPTLIDFRERIVELSRDPNLKIPTWLLDSIDEEINSAV
jgi:hypothetical protein